MADLAGECAAHHPVEMILRDRSTAKNAVGEFDVVMGRRSPSYTALQRSEMPADCAFGYSALQQ